LSDIKLIIPPQVSSHFIADLGKHLGVAKDLLLDLTEGRGDYFTSSLAWALHHARTQKSVQEGDIGLIIQVGAGIQVGCAIYYF